VLRSTGALLVGRRTQDVEDRLQPGFYGGAFWGPFFVLRHDPPPVPPVVKGVTGRFLSVDIDEAVEIAKRAAEGRDVVTLARMLPGYASTPASSTRSSSTSPRFFSALESASMQTVTGRR
jgi:hypothetical protein